MTTQDLPRRVWLHEPTGVLGYAITVAVFGTLWFFDDHRDDEILNERFVNFIDDHRNPKSLPSTEFVDMGLL